MKRPKKRSELESDVCELDRKIQENSVILEQKEIALRYAHEDADEKKANLSLHEKNLLYMKRKAEIVDIKEYSGVLKLYERARENDDDAALKEAMLTSAVAFFKKRIDGYRAEVARIRAVLDACGVLIRGPWQASAE